jgi:Na+-transporting NADH:ubiquinone oxidoreductase subunit NqrB
MTSCTSPPDEIILVYRQVGRLHVFTAVGSEMSGFHISHPDLKTAFYLAGAALGRHVVLIYGVEPQYEFERLFDDFEAGCGRQ